MQSTFSAHFPSEDWQNNGHIHNDLLTFHFVSLIKKKKKKKNRGNKIMNNNSKSAGVGVGVGVDGLFFFSRRD